MPTEGQCVSKIVSHLRHISVCIPLFLTSIVASNAQVSIKERVSIRPSSAIPLGVLSDGMSLEPISFSFGECGSLEGDLDSRYNDRIFIPRDGGIIGISFDSRHGRAGWNWVTCPDTLLVFDQNGALTRVYSFQPEQYDTLNIDGDSIIRPRIQHYLPVRQWEPLRFRLRAFCCVCSPPKPSIIVLPNIDTEDPCFSSYRTHFPVLYSPDVEDGEGGELIFRTGVQDTTPPCYEGDDLASRFPMEYIQYDPNANGPMPPVQSNFPVEVSVTGPYRLVITWGNSEVDDFLRMLQPRDTLLFSNVTAHVGETVSLGTFTAGTLVQFTNSRGFVCRMPLGGPRWALAFESGTDLRFDDFQAQLEFDAGYPDHLEVRAESDTVWYGDTVAVTIMPADDQGRLSPLGEDSLFEYGIELLPESQPYATLRYSDTIGPLIEHIPLTQAVGPGVKLIAAGVEPESTVTLQFRLKARFIGEILPTSVRTSTLSNLDSIGNAVGKKEDLGRKGISSRTTAFSVPRRMLSDGGGEVVMENDWSLVEKNDNKLRILDHSPWTIWPWLPAAQRVGISGYDPRRGFIIEVIRGFNQQPVKDESVVIKTEFVPMSGSHDHNDPVLPDSQQGTFYGQGESGNPLILKTDISGRAVVNSLVASQIAGRYIVAAYLAAASAIKDTVNLALQVPGLQLLTEDTNYVKVGGTCNHHGPRVDGQFLACRAPDNNHSISPEAADSLLSAARAFRNAKWNFIRERMRINDISLPGGGGFDIFGEWDRDIRHPDYLHRGHGSHRLGTDVDVENLSRLNELIDAFDGTGWNFVDEAQGSGSTRFPHFRFNR